MRWTGAVAASSPTSWRRTISRRSRRPPAPCSSAGGPGRSASRWRPTEPGSVDYPFTGPFFLLTHEPLDPPDPDVTILTGDIGEAVATALDAAGGKNLEILGADVAGQCLRRGLVDEILVYVLPVLLGDGIPFLVPGTRPDRPGTGQQHAVGRRHHPPVPRPQVATDVTDSVVIRPERAADHPVIAEVVRAAFAGQDPDDVASFVERIRASEHFIPELALVAEDSSGVIAHVMLSWVGVEGGSRTRILSLTPMSVRPDRQRIGVGTG